MRTNFTSDWYELWQQHSKTFVETAEQAFKPFFAQPDKINEADYLKQFNDWMQLFKNQWDLAATQAKPQTEENPWETLRELYEKAMAVFAQEWLKRLQEKNPIKSMQEFYALWIQTCQAVYEKTFKSRTYQAAWADLMDNALSQWKAYSG